MLRCFEIFEQHRGVKKTKCETELRSYNAVGIKLGIKETGKKPLLETSSR